MGDYGNPSKKLRLEDSLDAWENECAGNEDLWGQDDLTAEEFDMLEVQASQQVYKQNEVIIDEISIPGPSNTFKKSEKKVNISAIETEQGDPLVEKYALEGKIKQLTTSLATTNQELISERLSREQIISTKLDQFKNKETSLLQEIEKLQTAIQFKNQEVRDERTKNLALENKLKQQKRESQSTVMHDAAKKPCKSSPSKFPDRYSFEAKSHVKSVEAAAQTEAPRYRKYQLSLQSPRGETKEADIVATLLSAKALSTSAFDTHYQGFQTLGNKAVNHQNGIFQMLPSSPAYSAIFSNGEELDNLCKSYEIKLQDYLPLLKEQNLNHCIPCVFMKTIDASSNELKFSSPNTMESESQSPKIVNCLKEIANVLFYHCPKSNMKEVCQQEVEPDVLSANSHPLFSSDEEMEIEEIQQGHSLIELLCTFANPKSYSVENSKSCVIEWALQALTAWSINSIESSKPYVFNLPLHSLVSGKHGMGSAYLSLQFLIHFLTSKHFQKELVHVSGCCLFCNIGCLCHSIHSSLALHSTCLLITMVEDFLSGVFTTEGLSLFCENEYPCSSLVIQGVISMLSMKLTSDQDYFQSCCINVLEKGITLLSFMATHVQDFRIRRMPVEDNYVHLICYLSRLCQENHNFKRLQEMIRDLWDFQDDTNEFDTE